MKKGKHMKKSKNHIYINIITISLLTTTLITIMSHAKYTSEIKQETFNIEYIAGDIELELTDNANEWVIIPGKTIAKNTKITVKAKSEACYIFIKLEKTDNIENYIEYEIESNWVELEENTDVYYQEIEKTTEDTEYNIFSNNQIKIKEEITKQEIEEIENNQTIKFTAYAVQKTNSITKATQAWEMINK